MIGSGAGGIDSYFNVSVSLANGAVVRRDVTTGSINVGEPTSATHATTKNYVDTGLSNKQDFIIGGASSITTANLTANRALLSGASGKVAVSSVTNTELGYLSGVTSGVQTQLNSKLNSSALSLATGQVAFGSGTNTIGGDNGLF